MSAGRQPALDAIVVHWRTPAALEHLITAWPRDPSLRMTIVDNSGDTAELGLDETQHRVLRPGRNLGFAGGVNLALEHTEAPILLLLNPDVVPRDGAVETLLEACEKDSTTAGFAPRLVGSDGTCQYRWQLQSLPTTGSLLRQAALLPSAAAFDVEPGPRTPIPQPAAAALTIRRQLLLDIGGLESRYYPAWFEDVELAVRVAQRGETFRYYPQAVFEHALGSTVPRLGYELFLWAYYRNLSRFIRRHHGARVHRSAVILLSACAVLRALAIPLRKPSRAERRSEAFLALTSLARGAATGWHAPRRLSTLTAGPAA